MTKQIRITNADTFSFRVKVIVQEKTYDEKSLPTGWKDVHTIDCNTPGMQVQEYLTGSRRLVIEENGNMSLTEKEMTDNARWAYTAYFNAAGRVIFDGKPLPTWEELGEDRQRCWIAAANTHRTNPH